MPIFNAEIGWRILDDGINLIFNSGGILENSTVQCTLYAENKLE